MDKATAEHLVAIGQPPGRERIDWDTWGQRR